MGLTLASALRLRPATDDDVRRRSAGALSSDLGWSYREPWRAGPGGVYCAALFGPVQGAPWEDARGERWAHIELPQPIPHPVHETPMSAVPVLPPAWRRYRAFADGTMQEHGLSGAYRGIYDVVRRLSRLLELVAPTVVIDTERMRLWEHLDALFHNPAVAAPQVTLASVPYESLAVRLAAAADPAELTALLFAAGFHAEA